MPLTCSLFPVLIFIFRSRALTWPLAFRQRPRSSKSSSAMLISSSSSSGNNSHSPRRAMEWCLQPLMPSNAALWICLHEFLPQLDQMPFFTCHSCQAGGMSPLLCRGWLCNGQVDLWFVTEVLLILFHLQDAHPSSASVESLRKSALKKKTQQQQQQSQALVAKMADDEALQMVSNLKQPLALMPTRHGISAWRGLAWLGLVHSDPYRKLNFWFIDFNSLIYSVRGYHNMFSRLFCICHFKFHPS